MKALIKGAVIAACVAAPFALAPSAEAHGGPHVGVGINIGGPGYYGPPPDYYYGPPPGRYWVPGHWVHRHGDDFYIPGHWVYD